MASGHRQVRQSPSPPQGWPAPPGTLSTTPLSQRGCLRRGYAELCEACRQAPRGEPLGFSLQRVPCPYPSPQSPPPPPSPCAGYGTITSPRPNAPSQTPPPQCPSPSHSRPRAPLPAARPAPDLSGPSTPFRSLSSAHTKPEQAHPPNMDCTPTASPGDQLTTGGRFPAPPHCSFPPLARLPLPRFSPPL